MGFELNNRSRKALIGVHDHLIRVVENAAERCEINFIVTEGLRTKARQRELFEKGATRTLNSRHITGHAVDLAPLIGKEVRWDWPLFYKLSNAMKSAALELHVPLVWGGDWNTFKDGPHFELDRNMYP